LFREDEFQLVVVEMSTGTELPTYEPAFHADDAEQVASYRTVSALAVIGLVFGLASPLCFAWPLFVAIPLVGAVICTFAARRIEASDGALAGRWIAMVGLVLCVFSVTAAVSRNLVTRTIRTTQAEAFGREWIGLLLAGDSEEAFRRTVFGNRPDTRIPEPGTPAPTQTPQQQFLDHPIVAKLATAGADSTIQPAETITYEPQAGRQFVIQKRFVVIPPESGGEPHSDRIDVLLTLQRSRLAGELRPRWLVAGHELAPAADDAVHAH
jgi:hypothetical protein